jgi:hypothetical protein
MSSLIHPFIGIVPSVTFYVRKVPPDVLDLFEIQSGLHDLSQMLMLGLPTSGQQTNGQPAIRLDQQVGVARAHIHSHQNGSQFHGIVGGAGAFPERNSPLTKTTHPPGPGLPEQAPSVAAKT